MTAGGYMRGTLYYSGLHAKLRDVTEVILEESWRVDCLVV